MKWDPSYTAWKLGYKICSIVDILAFKPVPNAALVLKFSTSPACSRVTSCA